MKVLLIGSSGYIGSEFLKELRKQKFDVKCYDPSIDLRKAVKGNNLIINAAGYTGSVNVDDCNRERGRTMSANVLLVSKIKQAAHLSAVPWVHVSSGCVFDGEKVFSEKDSPNFTFNSPTHSFYSGSKFLAEQLIGNDAMCWVCRIRIPFDSTPHPKNYLTKLLTYPLVMSHKNSYSNLKESVRAMIQLPLIGADYGIYHVVNTGSTTAHDVMETFSHYLKKKQSINRFVDDRLFYKPIMEEPRSNAVLSNDKLLDTGIMMSDVGESFRRTCIEYAKHV